MNPVAISSQRTMRDIANISLTPLIVRKLPCPHFLPLSPSNSTSYKRKNMSLSSHLALSIPLNPNAHSSAIPLRAPSSRHCYWCNYLRGQEESVLGSSHGESIQWIFSVNVVDDYLWSFTSGLQDNFPSNCRRPEPQLLRCRICRLCWPLPVCVSSYPLMVARTFSKSMQIAARRASSAASNRASTWIHGNCQ